MRSVVIIIAGMLLTGCASRAKTSASMEPQPLDAKLASYRYEDASASALAFDPPLLAGAYVPELDRTARGEAAYVGYDEVITTFFYLRNDDRQIFQGDGADRYERRAISERFGVSYR
jgi:hypothetical protein